MAVFNEPAQWDHTLGNNADASTLPDDSAATAGTASLQKLFQLINATPLEAGGIAPDREDVNALFKYLGDQIFYTQNGGIPSYNAVYDYIPGRVVLYTDNNLYKCVQANGPSSTLADPTDAAYWSHIPTMADLGETSLQTSDIKIATSSTIPNGWLLCNGAAISRTTYANLFDKIGTTYGSGDGSTTFNIPDLRDRYIIGANTNALGAYIGEQLPNIRGWLDHAGDAAVINWNAASDSVSGALDVGTDSRHALTSGLTANVAKSVSFNASASNNTYTDSGKVYPLSLALNFIIKA